MNINLFFITLIFFLRLSASGLELGEQVMPFKAIDSKGKTWCSDKFIGDKKILVYFYPAAMTGGCTKQACAYRDNHENWQSLGVEVVGISGDQHANLALFKEAEKINFTLLSDPDGKIAQKFGVPFGKGGIIQRFVNGDKYSLERGVTIKRWTFLISKNGKLLYRNNQVNAQKDSENVLKFLTSNKNERI